MTATIAKFMPIESRTFEQWEIKKWLKQIILF